MSQVQLPNDGTAPASRNLPFVCPPPRLAADTPARRLADRLLPTGAAQWPFFALVAIGIIVASFLPLTPGLIVDAVATFAGSAWCVVNFWRCREAHCVVTGYGWAALAVLEVVELGLGRSVIGGDEGLVFLFILALGVIFEAGWRARYGSGAVIRE